MSEDNNIIDVRIEKRPLYLNTVDAQQAVFTDRKGYGFIMPRLAWNAKKRPGQIDISGEVVL